MPDEPEAPPEAADAPQVSEEPDKPVEPDKPRTRRKRRSRAGIRCPVCGRTGEPDGDAGRARCGTCGVVFSRARPALGEVAKARDKRFSRAFALPNSEERRDARALAGEVMRGFFQIRKGKPAALNAFGKNVLEVNCGLGFRLRAFQSYGWATAGTETSATAYEYARRQSLEVTHGWLAEGRFGRTRFDLELDLEKSWLVDEQAALALVDDLHERRRVLRRVHEGAGRVEPLGMERAFVLVALEVADRLVGLREVVVERPVAQRLLAGVDPQVPLLRRRAGPDRLLAALPEVLVLQDEASRAHRGLDPLDVVNAVSAFEQAALLDVGGRHEEAAALRPEAVVPSLEEAHLEEPADLRERAPGAGRIGVCDDEAALERADPVGDVLGRDGRSSGFPARAPLFYVGRVDEEERALPVALAERLQPVAPHDPHALQPLVEPPEVVELVRLAVVQRREPRRPRDAAPGAEPPVDELPEALGRRARLALPHALEARARHRPVEAPDLLELRRREVPDVLQRIDDVRVEVDKRGIRTKSWTSKKGREHGGRPLDKSALHRLLSNVGYVGKVCYKGEVYEGEQDGIVVPELFDRVQALLGHNGRTYGATIRNKHGALLARLIWCPACGTHFTHVTKRKGQRLYRYYTCMGAMKRGWNTCPNKSIPAHEIESFVVERIREIGRNPALVKETTRQVRSLKAEKTPELEAEHTRLRRELTRLNAELRTLAEALGRGGSKSATLTERIGELEERVDRTERRATEIREELVAIERETVDEKDLAGALAQFDPVWDVLFPREKRRILRLLIERVEWDRAAGTIDIVFRPAGIKTLAAEGHPGRKAAE
jgi:SAM-dependent methyltransferase